MSYASAQRTRDELRKPKARKKVRYCMQLPAELYDEVLSLAQRKNYPMAAIFRDGASLILERDKEAMALVRADRDHYEEAAK